MDRKGGSQAGHSKIQARDGQTQPEHQQDASRTWPEEAGHREGMARCKQVMGRYRLGRGRTQPEQAGHSRRRQDLLCTLADLAWHGSAPATPAPEPPAHSWPSERGPSPRSSSTAINWCQGLFPSGLASPLLPKCLGGVQAPGITLLPTCIPRSPSTHRQPKHQSWKALDHTKTEALAGLCSRAPPIAPTLPRAIRLPRILRCCIPRAPSLRDKNRTGDDTGDRGTSGALP